jgi:protein-L-isoaspartate(D-aspartate) O-methyltransferase
MLQEVNLIQDLHTATKRDYLARVTAAKPHCCEVARQFDRDYWDGDRCYGYGGYRYDGRWKAVARRMIERYDLRQGDLALDIGCGKGFLMHDLENELPGLKVSGVDVSRYAHHHRQAGTTHFLGNCTNLAYDSATQDFVYSINVFHNLGARELKKAVEEMMRVSKPRARRYLCVEAYRTEQEKFNLECWALTCRQYHHVDDWKWLLHQYGYSGDVEFITFA